MRAIWGGICVLLVFSSVQVMGLWGDKSSQTPQTNIRTQSKIANTTISRVLNRIWGASNDTRRDTHVLVLMI